MLYSSKSTFLTFSSQIPTNSVNLTKFLPFPYMRNIEYLRGTLEFSWELPFPYMRNGKTTEILSSLLWDSHKILWGISVRADKQLKYHQSQNELSVWMPTSVNLRNSLKVTAYKHTYALIEWTTIGAYNGWLTAYSSRNHYLNQRRFIFNLTSGIVIQ